MSINTLPVVPNARQVVGRCFLAGTQVPFVSFDVDSNSFAQADTFSVTLVSSSLPTALDASSLISMTSVSVKLEIGLITATSADWLTLIEGRADSLSYDPTRFELSLSGRDMTSVFIDNKASPVEKNRSASFIVSSLIKKHSLTPYVTATTTQVGTFDQIDNSFLQSEPTEWDVMAWLAKWEGFQVYVKGGAVYFEPQATTNSDNTYVITWAAPGTLAYPVANVSDSLNFERDLTISKGVKVDVSVHNSKTGASFVKSYPASAASTAQVYKLRRVGLLPDQALAVAKQLYNQVSLHEMKVSGGLPGDNILMPDTPIQIQGLGSEFDQTYYCDSVKRSFSWDSGYHMSFSAKNRNPNTNASTGE